MTHLHIDLETFSSVDLKTCGVYRYTESPDFEILLFGYSIDGAEVQVVDLANGETIPEEIIEALTDEDVQKWAHNASFERICLSRYLRDHGGFYNEWYSVPEDTVRNYLDPTGWRCSMVWAAYMGFPLSLEAAGAALGLEKQKMTEGKDLIRFFCKPCRPTATNGQRTRNLPEHAPDKWAQFKEYNRRDVEVELAIKHKLAKFPVPDSIWEEYRLDQEINDRGVLLDMTLVKNAITADKRSRLDLTRRIRDATNIDNPRSVPQMKDWLARNGVQTESLDKKTVKSLLETAPTTAEEVLKLRQQLAKSSVKKYQAMENAVCADGRARGMFMFYGANRTGRWAGRIIQLQNLPRNSLPDLDQARALVRNGNFAALDMLYDSVPDVLSDLIRTAFIPKPGHRFLVADFSSIEAVVLAWLAGEQWVLDAYANKEDLYIKNAEKMFGVSGIDKKSPLRQKSKVAVLACGYGGSVGAITAMGGEEMGFTESEMKEMVTAWRAANPNIVKFWWDVGRAALTAVRDKTSVTVRGITFAYQSGLLLVKLPSGRRLSYVKPQIGKSKFDSDCLTYMGTGQTKKWERLDSYGPKLVENITQAVSRDLLSNALQTLRNCFLVGHIHDEAVLEIDPCMSLEVICQQMCRLPDWAKNLPLRAEGFLCDYYKKD